MAAFIDDDLSTTPSDFGANNNWGDNTTAAGEVVGTAIPTVFEVEGSHSYSQPGTFSTGITVNGPNNQTKSASGTAIVGATPPAAVSSLTVFANAISQAAGQMPTPVQTVATFLDPDMADTASEFSAVIAWGDGHSSAGAVQGGDGVFTVTGSNAYAVPGSYTFTVTIVGNGGALTGSATGQAVIGSPYKPTGQQVVATAGQPFSGTLANFSDSITTDTPSGFSGVIAWGDGNTGIATIAGSNGSFSVSGSHTYADPGTFTITVTIANPTGKTLSVTDTANVVNTNPPGGTTPFNITGGLSNVVSNGPYAARGFTNTNRPTFNGTAPPYSTVQLYARHLNADFHGPENNQSFRVA